MRNSKAVLSSDDDETAGSEVDNESIQLEIGAVLGLPLSHKQRKGKVKNYDDVKSERKRIQGKIWL